MIRLEKKLRALRAFSVKLRVPASRFRHGSFFIVHCTYPLPLYNSPMPTGRPRTPTGDDDISGLELGKAAGAWAWKRREKCFENPFIDFLKRRWEDAKSDSDKAQAYP